MEKTKYLEILKQSLKTTWKNKFLWLFGFLILLGSFCASLGGDLNFNEGTIAKFISANQLASLAISIMITVVIVTLLLIKFLATAALIKSVNNIAVYGQSPIRAIFSESKIYVIRLFLLQLLFSISASIILVVMFFPAAYFFFVKNIFLGALFLTASLVIVIFLLVLLYFIMRYAQIILVLADVKIKNAIEMSYALLEKNMLESLQMGLMAIGINVAAFFVLMILLVAALIALSPFVLVAYLFFTKAATVVFTLAVIILFVMTLVFLSGFTAFSETLWVLFFQIISLKHKDEKEEIKKEEIVGEIPTPEAV